MTHSLEVAVGEAAGEARVGGRARRPRRPRRQVVADEPARRLGVRGEQPVERRRRARREGAQRLGRLHYLDGREARLFEDADERAAVVQHHVEPRAQGAGERLLLRPRPDKRQVGRRHDEHPLRRQTVVDRGEQRMRLGEVLEDLGADGEVERLGTEVEPGAEVGAADGQAQRLAPGGGERRRVDPEHLPAERPAAEVEGEPHAAADLQAAADRPRRDAQQRRHDEVDPGPLLDVVVEHPVGGDLVVRRRQVFEKRDAAGRAAQQRQGRPAGQDGVGGVQRALLSLGGGGRTAGVSFVLEPMEMHRGGGGSISAPPRRAGRSGRDGRDCRDGRAEDPPSP